MQAKYIISRCDQISLIIIILFILSLIEKTSYSQAQNRSGTVDKTIEIEAISGLKYDKVRFTVKPGSTVKIKLINADEMLHNLLVVRPGKRMEVVKLAEEFGKDAANNNYVPQSPNVLGATPLLKPGEEASFIFDAPEEEGIFPYVCTYPAHGVVMFGAIYVIENPDQLPPLNEDPHIPEPVRNQIAASMSMHPYPMKKPIISRLFMPQSSPAAIAVGMEEEQSYNWDAAYSYLRYVWSGGYIDASKQWDAKAHEVADVIGEIYYRNTIGFPFRIVRHDSVPKPDFKGYYIIDGYPQFIYAFNDIEVFELILPVDSGRGFQIQYRLENVQDTVWYALSKNDQVRISTNKGTIEDKMIELLPNQAHKFTITFLTDL